MKLIPKPIELVSPPPDGVYAFVELRAPTSGDIFPHQVVKDDGTGTAVLATGTDSTRLHLALSDTGPTLKQGSSDSTSLGEVGFWAARPDRVRAIPLTGLLCIISAKGVLANTHIGAKFGLLQEGRYTVLDLSNTTTQVATILDVVEGKVGDEYARVLVRFS